MLVFAISVFCYVLQNLGNKEYGRRFGELKNATLFQNLMSCTTAFALFLVISAGGHDGGPWYLAFLYGTLNVLTSILLVKAMSFGSLVASAVLCNVGVFFSSLYGVLRFGDEITPLSACASVLMLTVVFLSLPKKADRGNKADGMRWFLLAGGSGLTNGVSAGLKRAVVAMDGTVRVQGFLCRGYLVATVLFLALLLGIGFFRDRTIRAGILVQPRRYLPFGVLAGSATAGAAFFQMRALAKLSSVIVYPLNAGLLIGILSLFSFLRYRDTKLNFRTVASIVLCVAGIALYSI